MATKIKGIDISYHDGTINFKKVVEDGVKFIVIRQGKRNQIDKKFLEYVKECKKYKIPIMVYHFIYTDGATPKENAQSTVKNLKKAGLDHTNTWISADLEYDTWKKNKQKCTKERCTRYTKEYLDELKKLGCKKLFIYCNNDYYENYYDWSQLKGYPIWLACFTQPTPKHKCVMYQYSETGRVSGINAKVDMNWLYDKSMLTTDNVKNTTPSQEETKKEMKQVKTIDLTPNKGDNLNKNPQCKGTIENTPLLNVRTWAGKENKITSFSPLKLKTEIDICDVKNATDGSKWYYIKYNGKYGFVSSKYVKIKNQIKKVEEKKTAITQPVTKSNYDKYINSKDTHYISNCSSDERGRWSGGKAGDQTKKEWVLKAWYNRPWNYVLRHPDEKVRLKIAELGIKAALNDKIGYDQNQRVTYWDQLKTHNYDPSKIIVPCEADCSAGVIANTKSVGHLLNIDKLKNLKASYTGDMRNGFKKAGFKVLTNSKYTKGFEYLLPGDILLYENHHTATNITKGKKA